MTHIKAQVIITTGTGIPRDRVTNTLHFDNINAELSYLEAVTIIHGLLVTFYENIYENPYQPANWIKLTQGLSFINYYDMEQPEPRVPNRRDIPAGGFSGVASIVPAEVATVLSFQAPEIDGQAQSRRRGRIYIPGIASAMLTQNSTTSYPEFAAGWLTRVTTEAEALLTDLGVNLIAWSVYSTVAQTLSHVTNGWVDNAPDTQRRRGQDAVARTTWSG